MPGYLPGTLEAKLVAVFPGNHDRGLPSHQALIALFDEETGAPLCVMDGTVITAARTGATAAVAARALAREGASSLAVLGAGVQGRSHLDAFPRLFELDDIRVASRHPRHAEALAGSHPRARVVGVVRGGRPGRRPRVLLHRRGRARDRARVARAGRARELGRRGRRGGRGHGPRVVDLRRMARRGGEPAAHGLGRAPGARSGLDRRDRGGARRRAPGRRSDTELTLYKSTGHAVEDAAAARQVFDRATAEGVGTTFEL